MKNEEEIRAEIENEYFPIGIDKAIIITLWKQLGRVTIGKPGDWDVTEFIWDYTNPPKVFLKVIENMMKDEMKEEYIK